MCLLRKATFQLGEYGWSVHIGGLCFGTFLTILFRFPAYRAATRSNTNEISLLCCACVKLTIDQSTPLQQLRPLHFRDTSLARMRLGCVLRSCIASCLKIYTCTFQLLTSVMRHGCGEKSVEVVKDVPEEGCDLNTGPMVMIRMA